MSNGGIMMLVVSVWGGENFVRDSSVPFRSCHINNHLI